MDDPHLQNPKCPDCKEQLNNVISPRWLTSYPPYGCFGCKCGFEGYVMLEFSEEGNRFNEETKDMPRKFAQYIHILNENWLINLKEYTDADDKPI